MGLAMTSLFVLQPCPCNTTHILRQDTVWRHLYNYDYIIQISAFTGLHYQSYDRAKVSGFSSICSPSKFAK